MKIPSDDVEAEALGKAEALPNRKPKLLIHKCFIMHSCSYYERGSQQLKREVYRKPFES